MLMLILILKAGTLYYYLIVDIICVTNITITADADSGCYIGEFMIVGETFLVQ